MVGRHSSEETTLQINSGDISQPCTLAQGGPIPGFINQPHGAGRVKVKLGCIGKPYAAITVTNIVSVGSLFQLAYT